MHLIDFLSFYPAAIAVVIAFLGLVVTVKPPTTKKGRSWWVSVFAVLSITAIIAIIWQMKLAADVRESDSAQQRKDRMRYDSILTLNILNGVNLQLKPLKVEFNKSGKLVKGSIKTVVKYVTKDREISSSDLKKLFDEVEAAVAKDTLKRNMTIYKEDYSNAPNAVLQIRDYFNQRGYNAKILSTAFGGNSVTRVDSIRIASLNKNNIIIRVGHFK